MKLLRLILTVIIVCAFVVGQISPAYSAPKDNNGQGNNGNNGDNGNNGNNGNDGNNGQGNNNNSHNGNAQNTHANRGADGASNGSQKNSNRIAEQTKGESAAQKQQARRSQEATQRREAENRSADKNPIRNSNDSHKDLALNNRPANRPEHVKRQGMDQKIEKTMQALDLVNSLNRARWWQNPHDTRGQGNMGKVDMLDPFGHDKESDRKELYGNNGRPIREKKDDPPDLASILSIDFSLLGAEQAQFVADWFQRVLDSYYADVRIQAMYTYDAWYNTWLRHFYPGGTGDSVTAIRLGYNDMLNYTISADGWDSGPLLVTTTLIATEDYSGYYYVYSRSGTVTREPVSYSAGDVLSETTQEVYLDPLTGSYVVDASISRSNAVPQQQNVAYFVDLNVTVTDPSTGETATISYDKSLYLYRCPYGTVKDGQTGQKIVGAKITVHFEDGAIVPLDKATNKTASNPQVTDATGRFGFILQTNRKYYLTAQADGYEEYKSDVFTEQWHVLREDIKLQPKPEQMVLNVE